MKTWDDYRIDTRGKSTGEVQTTCPECSHQRKKSKVPCLSANLDKGVWVCHHCGWKGTLEDGADKRKWDHWRKPRYIKPTPKPSSGLPDKVVEWFAGRGISEAVLIRNKIWHGNVYMPQIEGETTAIGFPYFRDGVYVNQKYRDGRKNFRLEAGAERILYGFDDIDDDALIIVEGEIDKLSCEEAGFSSCVSVPDGAPAVGTDNYSSKFDFLDSAKESLDKVNRFILAVDSDEPGKRLEDELSRRLGRERCLRVEWPNGCKDANETLIAHGPEKLRECIAAASPYPVEGAFTTADLSSRIYHLYRNGWEAGQSTGWASLDKYYTVRAGEFTVVTGIPNSGKSNWIDALTINLAKQSGWNFAIFSPENQPLEDHMARQLEKWAEEPFHDGPTARIEEDALQAGMQWIDQHYTWILPADDWTLKNILRTAKELVYRKGIRGLVIDPWNELEHMRPAGISETEHISNSLREIRQFGRQHGVHVWIVAHPQKLYKDSTGNYPVPTPYDISGSAHWRNKADNCLTIWRDLSDPENKEVRIYVQKIRFRQIGKVGDVGLTYRPVCALYETQKIAW